MNGIRILVCIAALVLSAGCAPIAYSPASKPAEPSAGPAPAVITGEGAKPAMTPPAAQASRVDTLPSPEAERVLATIPEPLGGPPRAATPRESTRVGPVAVPEAAYDTLRTGQLADSDGAVPVPAPTATLGSSTPVGVTPSQAPAASTSARPVAGGAAAPTSSSAAGSAAAAGAAAGSAAGATAGAAPAVASGPCWRVQVAAPLDRAEAESKHAASQSLLMVPMVIEELDGRHKVRTRDCMPRETADAIKKRALDSGFDGSFVVSVPGATKPSTTKPPASGKASGAKP